MSVKYVSIIVVLLQRGLAEGAQGVVDLVEGVGLQHLDHVPLEVERGEGGEASQRAPAQVPDTDTPQLGVIQCRAVEVSKKLIRKINH